MLLAVVPVLHVASGNAGQYAPADLAFVMVFYAAIGAVLTAITSLAVARRAGWSGAVVIAAFAVAWLLFYSPLEQALRRIRWGLGRHELLVPAGLVATGLALWWLLAKPARRETFANFATVLGILAVGFLGVRVARDVLAAEAADRPTALEERLARPMPAPSAMAKDSLPDVWLLIPDAYANETVLRDEFGFDNHAFADSLRALGFIVPDDVRSDYQLTIQSVPSFLNFDYVTAVADGVEEGDNDPAPLERLFVDSRTRRFLRGLGYRVILVRNWWSASLPRPAGDQVFDSWKQARLAALIGRTELRRTLWNQTVAGLLVPAEELDEAARLARNFAALEGMASTPGPKFVMAHFMAPHGPYYVDAECTPLPEQVLHLADRAAEGKLYVDTIRCLNRRFLALVQAIRANSARPPIILIQGDHGSRMSGRQDAPKNDPAYYRSMYGAFGAYYLPGAPPGALPEPVVLVNLMRSVLNRYFRTELPMLPDSYYISRSQRPFDFEAVPPERIWPEGWGQDAPVDTTVMRER